MKTRLYNIFHEMGAKFTTFHGWEMPVEFSGVIEEHMAVRERVGLFDISHLGKIRIYGKDSLDFLQHVTCNDVSRLSPGAGQYTAVTTERGTPVDDVILFQIDKNEFFLITNASNMDKVNDWLEEHSDRFEVEVFDERGRWNILSLQGPQAMKIVSSITDAALDQVRPFHFTEGPVSGIRAMISRTGYTGEDGFEFIFEGGQQVAEKMFSAVIEAGKGSGLLPCGLGARDSLRLEAALRLYGNDMDEETTLLEAGLGWIVKLDKGEFIGRKALSAQKQEGLRRRLTGFELTGKGIVRSGYPVYADNDEVSVVTSGGYAPYLKKSIGLVYLPVGLTPPGSALKIKIRERLVDAVVVETPFYRRDKKRG